VASTGPRPRGRGIRTGLQLQRRASSALQRGRARAGAELRCGDVCEIGFIWLQRGRARAGAELSGPKPPPALPLRFNGAAPARARNWSARSMSPRRLVLLQRGRARAGAEFCAKSTSPLRTFPASTGPRPRGRGITINLNGTVSYE